METSSKKKFVIILIIILINVIMIIAASYSVIKSVKNTLELESSTQIASSSEETTEEVEDEIETEITEEMEDEIETETIGEIEDEIETETTGEIEDEIETETAMETEESEYESSGDIEISLSDVLEYIQKNGFPSGISLILMIVGFLMIVFSIILIIILRKVSF